MQRFATCMDCCAVQLPHLRFVQRAALEQHLRSFVWKVTFADATSHSTSSPAYPPQCQRLHIRLDADLLRAPHPRCIETMPHNVGVGQELPINRQSQRRASRRSAPESMERLRTENFFQHPQGAGTSARRPLRGSSCRHASSRCPSLCGGHGRLPSEPGLALTALPRPGCHYLALPAEVLPRLVADGPREAMLLQAAPTRGARSSPSLRRTSARRGRAGSAQRLAQAHRRQPHHRLLPRSRPPSAVCTVACKATFVVRSPINVWSMQLPSWRRTPCNSFHIPSLAISRDCESSPAMRLVRGLRKLLQCVDSHNRILNQRSVTFKLVGADI